MNTEKKHADAFRKVSVIMGVYNCSATLQRAIDSIRCQTYPHWEFIICDDGSTDETPEILQKNAEEDDRIVVLQNSSNIRLAATLNRCLSVTTGDYIARMDGDDESLPTRFEKQVQFLNEHSDIDCVGCNMLIVDGSSQKRLRRWNEHPDKQSMAYGVPFAHPTIMMRREVYEKLGGYTESPRTARCEDAELWYRFFAHGYKGYNIQEPLFHYTETEDDYKRRTIKSALNAVIVNINGNRMLSTPTWKLLYSIKPLISALLPVFVMRLYHQIKG